MEFHGLNDIVLCPADMRELLAWALSNKVLREPVEVTTVKMVGDCFSITVRSKELEAKK